MELELQTAVHKGQKNNKNKNYPNFELDKRTLLVSGWVEANFLWEPQYIAKKEIAKIPKIYQINPPKRWGH